MLQSFLSRNSILLQCYYVCFCFCNSDRKTKDQLYSNTVTVMITAALSYWEHYFCCSVIAFVCMLPVLDHNNT